MDINKNLKKYINWLQKNKTYSAGIDIWIKNLQEVLDSLLDDFSKARKILSFFGGMGSINDLVFYLKSGAIDEAKMKQYRKLNEQLYLITKKIEQK